jgi:Zn-dependent protease
MHLDRVTLIYFVALIVAIILHEIMHGVVALWLGDDTAKRAGRLTLNPVPHIDPIAGGCAIGVAVDRVGEAGAGESRAPAPRKP